MKLMHVIISVGLLVSHVSLFGMSDQQKQDAIDRLSVSMKQRCEKSIQALWPTLVPLDTGHHRIVYLKRLNSMYSLGYDTVIQNIQNNTLNPFSDPIAPSAPNNTVGMSDQQKQDAIELLCTAIKLRLKDNAHVMQNWSTLVHDDTGDNKLVYLVCLNTQFSLGFDTVIENIKNGVANPFEGTNVSLVPSIQPATAVATSSGMSEQEKQDAILELKLNMRRAITGNSSLVLDWAKNVPYTTIGDLDPALFPFLKEFNRKYTLGFDTVIENIEQAVQLPSTSLNDTDDDSDSDTDEDNADEQGATPTNTVGMNDRQKRYAIEDLEIKIREKISNNKAAWTDFCARRPSVYASAESIWLPFLKEFNQKHGLGFDKVIQNIEHDVPNPFEGTNVSVVTSIPLKKGTIQIQ